jgi:hypothetical protein
MAFLSTRTGQFTYFSLQIGNKVWKGKNILDFGGNIGNILRDPHSNIEEDRYWCLDIDKEALEMGKTSYPRAHWMFYDRYCFSFNPVGIPGLSIPDLKQSFDYIIAYSVFTNTTQTDMLQLVPQLEAMLSTNGALAFTFIDPQYCSSAARNDGNNFQWRVRLEIERGNVSPLKGRDIAERARHADWFMLVNGSDLYIETEDIQPYEPDRQKTCYVFHTERYMKRLFPYATILPPVNNEMQHCCLIRKS